MGAYNKSFELNHFKYIRNGHFSRQTGELIDDSSVKEVLSEDKVQNESSIICIPVDFPERF